MNISNNFPSLGVGKILLEVVIIHNREIIYLLMILVLTSDILDAQIVIDSLGIWYLMT